jgi:hypothetical protein
MADEALLTNPVRLHADRITGFGFALAGGLFVTAGLLLARPALLMLVSRAGPFTPDMIYDAVIGGLMLIVFGALTTLGLFWMLAPVPLIELDAAGVVYRPFPFMRRFVRWEDTEWIDVILPRTPRTGPPRADTGLKLIFVLTPEVEAAYPGREDVSFNLSRLLLPMSVDEFLGLLERYRPVVRLR